MGYIRKFESYKKARRENKLNVRESVVMKVDSTFKVKPMVDVTQSLINSYVKKVKEETGKELRDFYSDMDLAEALVKYIMDNKFSIENIPSNAFLGENAEKAEDDSTSSEYSEEESGSEEGQEETEEEGSEEEEEGSEEGQEGQEEEEGSEEGQEETGEEEEEGSEELPL